MAKKLLPSEWMTVIFLSSLIFTFAFFAYRSFHKELPENIDDQHFLIPQEIVVSIEGAVSSPGTYTLQKGATLEDLLALAEPTDQANLTRLRLHSKLRDGQKVRIPIKKNKKNS